MLRENPLSIENLYFSLAHSCVCICIYKSFFAPSLTWLLWKRFFFRFASHSNSFWCFSFLFSSHVLSHFVCPHLVTLQSLFTNNPQPPPYISQSIFLKPVFFHNFYILVAFSLPLKRHSLAGCQEKFALLILIVGLIFKFNFCSGLLHILLYRLFYALWISFLFFDHEFVIFPFNLPFTKGTARNWIIT